MKKILVITALCLTSTFAIADKIDDEVNAIYTRMSAAYQNLDAEQLKTVYDLNGHYLPNQENAVLLEGNQAIAGDSARIFNMVKKRNSEMKLEFRIVDRNKTPGMVTDIGYYVVTITPPEGSERKTRTNSGKFVTVSVPQEDGTWAFYNDINTNANMKFYTEAPKLPNLKYDK